MFNEVQKINLLFPLSIFSTVGFKGDKVKREWVCFIIFLLRWAVPIVQLWRPFGAGEQPLHQPSLMYIQGLFYYFLTPMGCAHRSAIAPLRGWGTTPASTLSYVHSRLV